MALIYIVEDDINIREIERYALKNSGFEVEEFDNGKDFFQRVSEQAPSLMLLDIMLPGEDGLEILSRVRKNPATEKTPVIMVTAKTTEAGGVCHDSFVRGNNKKTCDGSYDRFYRILSSGRCANGSLLSGG